MRESCPSWERHAKRVRIERRAEAESDWFYGTLRGRVPDDARAQEQVAALRIQMWTKELPSFHRGAFVLVYAGREWPDALRDEFGRYTSLVVRLECARHPAVGKSDAELEAASVERLLAAIADCAVERERRSVLGRECGPGRKTMVLNSLGARAFQHLALATRAYAKVRGNAACVVPGWVERPVSECE